MGHAAVWASISLWPSRRHTPLFRLTRTLGRPRTKTERTMLRHFSPLHASSRSRGPRLLSAPSAFFGIAKSAISVVQSPQIGRQNTCRSLLPAFRQTGSWFVRRIFSSVQRPNHSFNRKQWGMPSFGAPFHSAPNAVIPHCSG